MDEAAVGQQAVSGRPDDWTVSDEARHLRLLLWKAGGEMEDFYLLDWVERLLMNGLQRRQFLDRGIVTFRPHGAVPMKSRLPEWTEIEGAFDPYEMEMDSDLVEIARLARQEVDGLMSQLQERGLESGYEHDAFREHIAHLMQLTLIMQLGNFGECNRWNYGDPSYVQEPF